MSVRTLFPNLMHARPALPKGSLCRFNPIPQLRNAHSGSIALSIPRTMPRNTQSRSLLYSLGLGLTFLSYNSLRSPVLCETPVTPRPVVHDAGEPPSSMLDVYQLGFGTVCGICTGVFLKKGLRAIAFLLGGVFVLLQVCDPLLLLTKERECTLTKQYMSSKSFVNVDWKKLASSYDSTFGTKTSEGVISHPTAKGAGNWIIDFVTANFQRESFRGYSSEANMLTVREGILPSWSRPWYPTRMITQVCDYREGANVGDPSDTKICIIHQADHLSASNVQLV